MLDQLAVNATDKFVGFDAEFGRQLPGEVDHAPVVDVLDGDVVRGLDRVRVDR